MHARIARWERGRFPGFCCAVVGLLAASLPALGPTLVQAEPLDPPRNWKDHPAIVEVAYERDRLVYAIGDPHGEFQRVSELLRKEKLIGGDTTDPEKVTWTGGKALLICMGDMIDAKDQDEEENPKERESADERDRSVEVLQLFMKLRDLAPSQGGQVVVLCGNHEAEFLANPDKNKVHAFRASLARKSISPALVAKGEDALGLGKFLRSLPFALKMGNYFFAHAGNMNFENKLTAFSVPDQDTKPRSLDELRKFLESTVNKGGFKPLAPKTEDSLLNAKLKSPWWEKRDDKNKPTEPAKASEDRLRKWVEAVGAQHLVIGHQPGEVTLNGYKAEDPKNARYKRAEDTMAILLGGLLFLTDTGLSASNEKTPGALLQITYPVQKDMGGTAYYEFGKRIQFDGETRVEKLIYGIGTYSLDRSK